MKRAIMFSLIFLFVGFSWSLNPALKRAEAVTLVSLDSPPDSSRIRKSILTLKWRISEAELEEPRKYYIVVARDFDLTDRIWEDSTYNIRIDISDTSIDTTWLSPPKSIVYDGPSFEEWETYFWSVRVLVDSLRINTTVTPPETTFVPLLYNFVDPYHLLHTTATLVEIPDSLSLNGFPEGLRTIQVGIIWAGKGDTVLVKPGIYYENLRFYKDSVILASHFVHDTTDIAVIYSTVIDGDSLTRGDDYGSVIHFTSDVDSNSAVIGFTIRNGKGTKVSGGTEDEVNGGGIFCEPGSTPTIAYNVITQNQTPGDGGGIYCNSAAPNIFKNIITQNSAGGSGGAIQCSFSIRMRPPAFLSPPGGEGEKDRLIEVVPKTNPAAAELNSKTEEDDLENSLYPKDATEVFPAPSSDPLAKPAQNHPPVAVLDYSPKKEKYFIGDIILLDASGSYDPDTLEGDRIIKYWWKGYRWGKCENPDDSTDLLLTSGPREYTKTITVEAGKGGPHKIWVWVEDRQEHLTDTSEIVYLNVQQPPTADAGEDFGIAPGDTAWLDASGSCDINPGDTVLSYNWTQIEGPVTVALSDSQAINPYFETEDTSIYLGEYQFQLKVTDPDDFSLDTITVVCSNRPLAVCFDSLAGFPATIDTVDTITSDTIAIPTPLPLDGSLSSDPDSALGDSVKYFIWKGISYTNCTRTTPLLIDADSTKEVQYFPASRGGGIYRVSLYVRDKFGVRSENTDTLVISVQLPPEADAGPDTIILRRAGSYAVLHGSAKCELNWDQLNSLEYRWFKDPGNPQEVVLLPNSESPRCSLTTTIPGVYLFFLRVTDIYQASSWDDTVKVTINAPPKIDSITPKPLPIYAEGDNVALRVWAYDEDAEAFVDADTAASTGEILEFNWTAVSWPNFPDNTYKPNIIGSATDTVKFVPLKHGEYKFQVEVHDIFSRKQDPSLVNNLNLDTITVRVDTTLAYPIIMGNLISFNTADLKGGGIDCFRSSPEIINNIFYKNESGSSGGAICSRFLSAPYIERNILFGNTSGNSTGGGIANLGAEFSPAATIGFKEKPVFTTNCFWDNAGGDLYPTDVPGNLYEYPRLIDPEYGDFTLECSSPCLDDSIGLLLWLYPDTCDEALPLTVISLSLFQHPVATAVAHFLVNTDVPLKAPPVGYITVGESQATPVDFTSISSTTYRGDFLFTTSGTAQISVFASSVQEIPDTLTKDFTVQLIGAGKIGKLASPDNRLEVLFPQGVAEGEIYATCIPVSDDPQHKFEDKERLALGEAYHLGPPSDFEKELTISFPLDDYDLTEKDKTLFSIYRYETKGWERQASFLDGNSICAQVKELGVYRLIYDAKQEHISGIPKTYQLFQNYPNPFNPQTMIKYDLPNPGHVNITVYNILGQKVKSLVDEHQEAGHKSVIWDGKDGKGKEVASGIYFYKIKTVEFEKTRKMVLLK